MSERIFINIYFINGGLKKVWINTNSSIGELNRLFPKHSYSFVFQGKILSKDDIIFLQDIKENSLLIALSPQNLQNEYLIQSWLLFSKNHKSVSQKLMSIYNPNNQSELCRICDIKLMKKEMQKKRGRPRYCPQPIIKSGSPQVNINIDYHSLTQPSISPLPIFWNENEI